MDKPRTNFFGDRVHPSAQYQLEEWYWPTDEEFRLIETLVHDGDYFAHYIERYGEANAQLLLDRLFRDGGTQYVWLSKNLPTPTDENPLTEVQLLEALRRFDAEIVEPWLAKWGQEYSSVSV